MQEGRNFFRGNADGGTSREDLGNSIGFSYYNGPRMDASFSENCEALGRFNFRRFPDLAEEATKFSQPSQQRPPKLQKDI